MERDNQITRQITLARRPVGIPVPDDFALTEAPRPVPGPPVTTLNHRTGTGPGQTLGSATGRG